MSQKMDRRIQRSRNLIKDTYLSLIHEKESIVIPITEIVNRCEINRSTFYVHFQTKEQLQKQIISDILDELRLVIQHTKQENLISFFDYKVQLAIFQYVGHHSFAFQTLLSYTDSFLNKLSIMLFDLFLFTTKDTIATPQIHATYYSSVITGMICHWCIQTNFHYNSTKIAEEITQLFQTNLLLQKN